MESMKTVTTDQLVETIMQIQTLDTGAAQLSLRVYDATQSAHTSV